MIARMWRGWVASVAAADTYEEFLRSSFLPAAYSIPGYEAAHVAPRARELLSRFDARCVHSELVIETTAPGAGS